MLENEACSHVHGVHVDWTADRDPWASGGFSRIRKVSRGSPGQVVGRRTCRAGLVDFLDLLERGRS